MMPTDAGYAVVEVLARRVHAGRDLTETLGAVLEVAVDICDGVQAAGINLYRHRRFEPQAVFGVAPHDLDALQQRTGEGPSIEASRTQALVVVDTLVDPRWPEFGALARELGVRTVACAPLWVDASSLGSLSLYSSDPGAPGDAALRLAALLATQSALAIASGQLAGNLRVAIDSRDVIGQAKGILMERHRITADEAFNQLWAASQHTHARVSRVAEILASTGELPGAGARRVNGAAEVPAD